MAGSQVHINWAASGTTDVVAAARRAMQGNGRMSMPQPAKPVAPAVAAAAPVAAPQAAPVAPKATAAPVRRAVRLKKLKAIGGVAGVPSLYALAVLLLMMVGVAGVWKFNVSFAPEMYADNGMVPAAVAHAKGQNYAVFDLNLNIRRWKEELIKRLTYTPDLVVIGASQWQEAHAGLVTSERMFNSHIHRDYWEDFPALINIFARSNKLPKHMILAIRDKQFTPVELRKDYLWEPGIPNYREMADRLGIQKESLWKTLPWQRMRERLSLSMLFNNVTRWYNAEEWPHATSDEHFQHLDTLLPDGSILWSGDHRAIFTAERTKREALALAAGAVDTELVIDPQGVAAWDATLDFLKSKGVQVVLVHPPYNPIYFEAIKGSRFFASLNSVREVTRDLAKRHGLHIIGDFDPSKVGCKAEDYIDAEHSSPTCLKNIFDQYEALLPQLTEEAAAQKVAP